MLPESIPTLVPRLRLTPRLSVRFSPSLQRPRLRQTYEPLPIDIDKFEKKEMAKTRPITKNIWYPLYD